MTNLEQKMIENAQVLVDAVKDARENKCKEMEIYWNEKLSTVITFMKQVLDKEVTIRNWTVVIK